MTPIGLLLVDGGGILLLLWVLNLVRLGRLYVGYAALFVVLLSGIIVTASTPPLARSAASAVDFLFPSGGILFLLCGFIILLFVYILSQLTILSNRLAALVQDLAIKGALDQPLEPGSRERRSGPA